MSAENAFAEKPKPEPKAIDPVTELFYLDTIDRLTVDLEACKKMVEIKEDPPECKAGFPWKTAFVALVVGYVANDIVK